MPYTIPVPGQGDVEIDCDYPAPSIYLNEEGTYECRCLVCARCGKHTGNSMQGHYWAICKVTKTLREFHFCCEDSCELEDAPDAQDELNCSS